MYGGTGNKGYTIVEVMIFLAVSGFMFLLAAAFVTGKQSTAEFRQGMNDINTQVEQTINNVADGFYPSNNNIQCGSQAAQKQGTNLGCAFIGKIMQFSVGNNPSAYVVESVIGNQCANTTICTLSNITTPPSSFVQAAPQIVSAVTANDDLEWGLRVSQIYDLSASASGDANPGAIGFFDSFSQFDANSNLESGSQTVNVVPIPNSALRQAALSGNLPSSLMDTTIANEPNPQIDICFDGSGGWVGLLTIGGSSGRLTTAIQISNTTIQINANDSCS
jgi:hypothetical protein